MTQYSVKSTAFASHGWLGYASFLLSLAASPLKVHSISHSLNWGTENNLSQQHVSCTGVSRMAHLALYRLHIRNSPASCLQRYDALWSQSSSRGDWTIAVKLCLYSAEMPTHPPPTRPQNWHPDIHYSANLSSKVFCAWFWGYASLSWVGLHKRSEWLTNQLDTRVRPYQNHGD